MKKAKKLVFTGVILLLVMFFSGTCDALLSGEDEVEYTDVVYSKDGSQITVYLDGETVPVSKSQRAMSLDLAQMSYDFLEVIFVNLAGVSRSSWELGEPAGISGSGLRIANSSYSNITGTLSATLQYAAIFAGKKDGKTLFGVGKMTAALDKDNDNTFPAIDNTTTSVTFSLAAIHTGLLTGTDSVASTYATRGVPVDSFKFTGGSDSGAGYTARTTTNSGYQTLSDGIDYPTYTLPKTPGTVTASYTFSFLTGLSGATPTDVTANYLDAVKHVAPNASIATQNPMVQKRTARYMDGGRYLEARGHLDTKTKVIFTPEGTYDVNVTPTPTLVGGANFINIVPLTFNIIAGSGGLFSFYLQIPVYMLNNGAATLNQGPGYTTWYIRTGLGSDLYSLDDGISSGGCVFMSSGVSNSDWITIDWQWIQ